MAGMNELDTAVSSTIPLIVPVVTAVAAIRRALPVIDGPLRVLAACAVVAVLVLLVGASGPSTVAGAALLALKAICLAAESFGAVNLGDRWRKPNATTVTVSSNPDLNVIKSS